MKIQFIFAVILVLIANSISCPIVEAEVRECSDGSTTDIRDFCVNGASTNPTGHIVNLRGTDTSVLEGIDDSTYKFVALLQWWFEYLVTELLHIV